MEPTTPATVDQRLLAIKSAIDSMYYEIERKTDNTYSSTYLHKDMREIIRRAERFIAYATGTEEADTKGLISKLRDVLCSDKA